MVVAVGGTRLQRPVAPAAGYGQRVLPERVGTYAQGGEAVHLGNGYLRVDIVLSRAEDVLEALAPLPLLAEPQAQRVAPHCRQPSRRGVLPMQPQRGERQLVERRDNLLNLCKLIARLGEGSTLAVASLAVAEHAP